MGVIYTHLFLTAPCAHIVLAVEGVVLADGFEHEGRRLAFVYRPLFPVFLEEDAAFCTQQGLVLTRMVPVFGTCKTIKKYLCHCLHSHLQRK